MVALFLSNALQAFHILLQVGAGTGLLYLIRWFWWRVTAWCEIVAMISSFGVSVLFLILRKNGIVIGTHRELLERQGVYARMWALQQTERE